MLTLVPELEALPPVTPTAKIRPDGRPTAEFAELRRIASWRNA
ncbi:MAG: hypothetical protein R2705_09795 [Ilumatobacteraceae bacterium]